MTEILENPSHNSPFIQQYKTPGTKNSQTIRRYELLKAIKERRHTTIDEKRCISEVFEQANNEDADEPMDVTPSKTKRKKQYANKLMLSEWMIDKPDDLESLWLMKVCPKGVRNLVVAHKGKTTSYNKGGHFIKRFNSQLPGGSPSSMPMKFTILDCIYSEDTEIYYVLDVLVWNSYSVINSTTEFRFFFLQSKMAECPQISECSNGNMNVFKYISHKQAELSQIEEEFSRFDSQTDGVLFYHSELSYLSQVTPLVGWLKVFMVPEILGVPINNDYLLEKPKDYTILSEYAAKYEKIRRKQRRSRIIRDVEMTEDCEENIMESEIVD